MKQVKRYIPTTINDFLINKTHCFIKYNKDLSSTIYTLDYDGLVIICDTILRVAGSRDIDKNNFCEIQTSCFHKILHNDYKIYLDYLIENRIVISDGFYIAGSKSISYKLNENFIDELSSIDINNSLFNKRTIKAINSFDKLNATKKHITNYKKSFKIDFDKAIQHLVYTYTNNIPDHKGRILNRYTKTLLEHKLRQINDDQLWINRSSTNGRINSNLTTLNGDYKQFILGYDNSLDIVASQPTLLNILFDIIKDIQGSNLLSTSTLLSYEYKILSKTLEQPVFIRLNEELKLIKLPSEKEQKEWRNLCERGELYEFFMREIYNKTGVKKTRTEVKEIMMTTLYSSNHSHNEYKKLFKDIFPSIFNFIVKIKGYKFIKRSHRLLPIMLQIIESFLWCETILPKLDRMNIPYLFIHDSVIIKEKDIERTELIIMEQFFINKINVKIKNEKIND